MYRVLISCSSLKAYLSVDGCNEGSSNIQANHDNAMNPLLAQKGFYGSSKV